MSPREKKSPQETGEAYRSQFSDYEVYLGRLKDFIRILIEESHIDVMHIEKRVKSVESFIDKGRRKNCQDPLEEITDKIGLRVITYYDDDIEEVANLIRKEFDVDLELSDNKREALKDNEFSYRSLHLVVKHKAVRATNTEWKRFATQKAEIQIRSILQHAWASISHKTLYKKPDDVPPELRRQLNSLSALLEVADREFIDIRKQREGYVKNVAGELKADNLDLALNLDSLDQYIRLKVNLSEWEELSAKAGYIPWDGDENAYFEECTSMILDFLRVAEVPSLSEFRKLLYTILNDKDAAIKILKKYQKVIIRNYKHNLFTYPLPIVTVLLVWKIYERLPADYNWSKHAPRTRTQALVNDMREVLAEK